MNNNSFSLENGVLWIAGRIIDKKQAFTHAIWVDDKIIARFEPTCGSVINDNVVCYNKHGKLLWTIQSSPHGGTKENPYMNLKKFNESTIVTQNWNGIEYRVNLDDGTVSPSGFQRF